MKRFFYSIFVTLLFSLSALAQNEGINFQGVARNAAGEVLVSQKINLRLSILLGSESGSVAYMETRQVTTNPLGVFAVVVGDDKALTKSTNFSTINWTPAPKFIKVEMDPNAGSNYLVMGTSRLQAVPFAFYANGVDASNVKGVLPVSSGGTGATSITDLKASLGLDQINNTALDTKVDKITGKGLSTNDYTSAEKTKLASITGTNTGDQDLSRYAMTSQLATKANASDVATSLSTKANASDMATSLSTKANTSDVATSLSTKANISDVTTSLVAKEDVSNKSNAALGTSTTIYPTQNAVKTYVDAQVASATIADADATTKGKLQLTGDLGGTASSPTVPSLALKANSSDVTTSLATKEDVSNKSNAAIGTSTRLYPTQNAVKVYVDTQIAAATIPDADASTKGKLQLAGDLGGTAASPTVPGLLLKEDVSRKSTATDLGAGSTSDVFYPSQKAVKSYVDTKVAAATIADANATTKGKLQLAGDLAGDASAPVIASGAITSSKIQDRSIATDDIADLAITDAKISGMSGSKVDGNIAGNAANVTGTVAVGNGGTGATSLTGYVKGNGTSAMTTLSTIPVADVTGAIRKVNGTLPNASGDVTITFGEVTTGTLANRPPISGDNGDIYVVSGDVNTMDNGRTFISDGTQWNEVTANVASTDARYVKLSGGVMDGILSFPTGKKVVLTDAPSGSTDATNKAYVDSKISEDAPNATSSVPGKVQLTGDLGGTATAPTVPGLVLKAPIDNPAFTGTVTGITKSMVGLANVDNTSDANKPVSSAAQTALDLKAPSASPTFTGTVSGITKAMVDLGNVDNTSDANKPVSTAAQTALNLKENASNKSDAPIGTSTTLFPTQNAVKTYVDAQIASGAPDADATTKGKVQLAGDLGGSAAAPTVPGLALKAPIESPTFTGTVGGITKSMVGLANVDNTSDANKPISSAAQAALDLKAPIESPTFTGTVGGITKSMVGLANVDNTSDANKPVSTAAQTALNLKENASNKSDAPIGTSTTLFPTQNAVKIYVDAQIASGAPDADATTKGKLQLAGDLTGDASAPIIATGAITSSKIQDRSIATDDIADLAITDAKISGMSGSKVDGNIPGNAANVTGTVAVGNGGTGATGLTGYVKGNGLTAMTSVSSIPVADVTGAIRKVNGTLPNASGEVAITFGEVSTGTLANLPPISGDNGDIYVVSGDGNTMDNGRTYISDGTQWIEVTGNVASTDARYLQLTGGIMNGNLSIPTGKKVILTDAPSGSTDAANKGYVDAKISADAPNATSSVPGKVQLAGDLGGSASAPTVPGLALKAPIDNPAFTGTVTGITKSMVGLANVDNTADADKPVSLAAQTALDLKAPLASPTFTGTVGGITKSMVGLGNVDNTSDASKPISSAAQAALDLKAPIESPTFTGTVGGITKAMVGLANVNNTTDADKPVSTAAQTALDLKENASNKSDAALGTSTTLFPTQNAVKTYVDAQISSATIADADASTKGKVQLAGDLAGTGSSAAAPIISNNAITTIKINGDAVTSAKIADGAIVNADISSTAAIEDTKLAAIATAGKVSNSATTATSVNANSAIVARDGSGNFSAGTITANLTGNATNVTGTVAVANGGTGVTTAAANAVFAGPATGAAAAPSFRSLVAADMPSGSANYINNTSTQQTASFSINGSGTIGTDLTVSGLTASKPVFTDANKKLTSSGTLGVSQGGTGLTAVPTNGQILIGNGNSASGFTLATLSAGSGITITNSSGGISIAAAVRPTTDQFLSTANQTSFTLTQTPLTNATVSPNVKQNVWMFINGVRTDNRAYTVSGTTVTYVPAQNGAYALLANDRIQFDYAY